MAGFLYYSPNSIRIPAPGGFDAMGLSHVFDGQLFNSVHWQRGPEGSGSGFCYTCRGVGLDDLLTDAMFDADAQTWHKIPKTDAWVGYWNDRKPTPEDLEREHVVDGFMVPMGDGNKWISPIARQIQTGENLLPTRTGLDDDGNWTRGDMAEVHARLWEKACRFWDLMSGENIDEFEFGGLRDAALQALAVNYRIGKAEVVLLDLFATDEDPEYVLYALVGWPQFDPDHKKKLRESSQETSSSSDGVED